MNKLSIVLANYLADKLNYDEDQADILRYGFEVMIGEFIKITILFSLSLALGIFPYVLLITLTSVTYRFLSGGIHFNTYGRCLIFSLILILILGTISKGLENFTFSLFSFSLLVGVVFLISFLITSKYAPVETENKPLGSNKRGKMKKLSLIWLGLCFTAIIFCLFTIPLGKIQTYIIAILLSVLMQAISLLPVVVARVTAIDDSLDKLFLKGGEKYVQNQS